VTVDDATSSAVLIVEHRVFYDPRELGRALGLC